MEEVTEPEGSPAITGDAAGTRAATRAVAESVTGVSWVKYSKAEDVLALEAATCYFFLKIDNKIVTQEQNGVLSNDKNKFYPQDGLNLGNGVKDKQINTDNTGSIIIAEWQKLGLMTNGGLSYATVDQPIPESIFAKAPTFEQMALHIPDSEKEKLAGSVEALNSDNYKIFWYVAKWQDNSDKAIHVDGILVPKTQVTVNVPEYKKRIIVEDLKGNINASTTIDGSDFDYNDIVFDAITWNRDGKNHLKIILRAAGGQMPIYVHGKEVHEGIGYMFNTSDPDYEFGKVLVEDYILGETASTFDFNSIDVWVDVDGTKSSAGSNIGEAPEKIAVGLDYKWCKEKQNIKDVYPRFTDYVGDKTVTGWWK